MAYSNARLIGLVQQGPARPALAGADPADQRGGLLPDLRRGARSRPAASPNFIAYLCTGLFIFNFTQSAALAGTQAITGNLGLIRALHFPRACLPLATTLTQFQHALASMVVLAGIVLVTGEPITLRWLLIVPTLLLQAVFNAGLALLLARLGSRSTDLKQVMPFVMRTWMYGSGVLYSVTLFEEHLPGWAATAAGVQPDAGLHRAGPLLAAGVRAAAPPRRRSSGCSASAGRS